MPRFFFHLYQQTIEFDREGKELTSAAEAREEAKRSARKLASSEVLDGHLGLSHRIEVTDAYDGAVAIVRFKDVVKLHP